jgi:uncharacterized coiled-coil protein SlyX
MRTLADVEKNGRFSEAVINSFKQYVIAYCGGIDSIKALGEKEWNKSDSRNLFIRFMDSVDNSIVTIIPGESKSVHSETPMVSAKPAQSLEPTTSSPILNDIAISLTEGLLKSLSSASKEAAILLKSLSDSNGTIALLRNDIESRDYRISELSSVISERNRDIAALQRNLEESQRTTRENESQIADLSERLKTSLQMDNISQNQELITLKTNLQNSLKVEYADYLSDNGSECNPDTYGALLGSLARIFKTLRRFGIIID